MANRYWVGGAGTWDSTNTTNWSATSGGAGGATVPTAADIALFDTNSGTGTVTFTNGGVSVGGVTHSAANIVFELGSALNSSGTFRVDAGTFNTNNYNLTCTQFSSTTTLTRNISLGSSTITITGVSTPFNISSGTNLTFNLGTSTINVSGANNAAIVSPGLAFYNLNLTSTNSWGISGANSFNNLTIAARTSIGINNITFSDNQIISGTLTLSASTDSSYRTVIRSTALGTPITLDVTNFAAGSTNIDFRDIDVIGNAAPISGTRFGDAKGNSGIIFDTPKTVYWNFATGGSWSGARFALTAGGAVSTDNFPLAQDTVVFLNTGLNTGVTVTIDSSYFLGTINLSARTNSWTLATAANTPVVIGNWTNGSGVTQSGTGAVTFSGRGLQTLTSSGKAWPRPLTINSPGGSVVLQDAFTSSASSSSALVITQGTFDANNYNLTLGGSLGAVNSSGTGVRTIAIGSGTWIIPGSGTPWNCATATNLTVTGTGTISLTSSLGRIFAGGDIQTYPTLNQGGGGQLTISGSNKFNNITNTAMGSIRFTSGTTTEFNNFNLNGQSSGFQLFISATSSVQANIKRAGTWYMGANSTNTSNNTGLVFTSGGGIDFLNIRDINGISSVIPVGTYNGNFFAFF